MAERIQLQRTKGWRKPRGVITVARPTVWGNPFLVGDEVSIGTRGADGLGYEVCVPLTAAMAVAMYRGLMDMRLLPYPPDAHADDVAWQQGWVEGLAKLAGHDLACWCALDEPCHADVLLELANPSD